MTKNWVKNPELWIYVSHVLSSWGDRMWTFAVGLYLVILWDDSLILTAVLGFSMCISGIVLGAFIGEWIDKTQRMKAARMSIGLQNFCVFISALILLLLILNKEKIDKYLGGHFNVILLVIVIIISVIAELASLATKISLEKDWIIVIADEDENKLSRMNSIMRTINLSTYILAPITVGQIFTYSPRWTGAVFVASWNIFSAVIEISLLNYIYKLHPKLGIKKGSGGFEVSDESEKSCCSCTIKKKIVSSAKGWKEYWNHKVRNAGLGLACVYLTVLAFDNVTRGYLYGQGLSESVLGVFTGIGAAFGIIASVSFPFIRKKIGVSLTGLIGFTLLVLTLIFCVISVFAPGSPFRPKAIIASPDEIKRIDNQTSPRNGSKIEFKHMGEFFNGHHNSDVYLLFGVIISRFGLWLADLSINQIFQKNVQENKRGVINGVQSSLNQFMNLFKFLMVIILPGRCTFGYLVILSWLSICSGYILYITYVCQNPKKQEDADAKRDEPSFEEVLKKRRKSSDGKKIAKNESYSSLASYTSTSSVGTLDLDTASISSTNSTNEVDENLMY